MRHFLSSPRISFLPKFHFRNRNYLARVPADPFDGKALRYKKLGKGYIIYSLGESGTDYGGVGPDPLKVYPSPFWKTVNIPFRVDR